MKKESQPLTFRALHSPQASKDDLLDVCAALGLKVGSNVAVPTLRKVMRERLVELCEAGILPPDDAGPYCTTYCNRYHGADGKPLDHECFVLPRGAIAAERAGHYQQAIDLIDGAKPLRAHRGVRTL